MRENKIVPLPKNEVAKAPGLKLSDIPFTTGIDPSSLLPIVAVALISGGTAWAFSNLLFRPWPRRQVTKEDVDLARTKSSSEKSPEKPSASK